MATMFGIYPFLLKLYADGGRELERIFSRARAAGAATSLDMSLPDPASPSGKADWRAILERALPHVDIFVPSIKEILFMLAPREYRRLSARGQDAFDSVPERTFRELGDRILAMGVRVLLIKAGRRGAYLRTGDVKAVNSRTALDLPAANWSGRETWASSFRADRRRFVNANGAGDAAVAGFLAAILDGERIEDAGRLAMLAGRDSLYGADALTGLRAWADMKADLGPAARRGV